MAIVKALDILRDHIEETGAAAARFESYAVQTILKDKSILDQAEQTAKKYRGEVDVLNRIAKVVEAAQAWAEADSTGGMVVANQADIRLHDALAALDAEEGQAAETQEGEHP